MQNIIGQPLFNQIINLINKSNVLHFSRSMGGERYIKRFDSWTHLVVMLYAVIMRFDSLREILLTLIQLRKSLSKYRFLRTIWS
ncbi:DUF4372 domain-containing protein [Prevotella bivia]